MASQQLTAKRDVEVKVSPDKMKAYLLLTPADREVVSLNLETVRQRLLDAHICFGIKSALISKAIKENFFNKSFVAAEGEAPVNGQDAVVEYHFNQDGSYRIEEDLDGRVNFKEAVNKIEIVHNGDLLAEKRPPTKGIPGKNVFGGTIQAKDGQDIRLLCGENTRLSPDGLKVLATDNGYVVLKDGRINVLTCYEVTGDVDMGTGNIYFVGSVKIKGSVREGFTVQSNGNIEIGQNIENAAVRSDANITVGGGIIGRKSMVYAKGDLRCKFVEYATLEVNGNVFVDDAILHGQVQADGNVIVLMGKKGVIMGGRISAGLTINAKNIGSISEPHTEVEAGIPPAMREEVSQLMEALEEEREELRQVKLRASQPSLAAECQTKQTEIENSLLSITHRLNEIKRYIATNREGKISVYERIWPGVKLTVGSSSKLIKVDENHVTFVERLGNIECWEYERPKPELARMISNGS